MSITGTTDLGNGVLAVTVDHDPTSVATDAPEGSIILQEGTSDWYKKEDDGVSTNVSILGAKYGNTLLVAKTGGDYDTIQAAINASGANDTIIIHPGTYIEAVTTKAGGSTTLVGEGAMGSVVIQQDAATVMTVPATPMTMAFIKNIKLKSNAVGADPSKLLVGAGLMMLFSEVAFDYDMNNGYCSSIVTLNAGNTIFTNCKFDFDGVGTAGAESNFVTTAGAAMFAIMQGFGTMSVTAVTASENLHFIKDLSSGANNIRDFDCRLDASGASFAGSLDFYYGENSGSVELQSNKLLISTPSGAVGSYGRAYRLAGTGGGAVHSSGNRVEVAGFADNYFADISATETLYSHFDDVVAAQGTIDAGTYRYVNSPSNGDLQLSGVVIPNTIDVTSDYGATESWVFNEAYCDSSSALTMTFPVPASMVYFPNGSRRMMFNNGTGTVYIDPNGNDIDGSPVERMIQPNGWLHIGKIDDEIRVLDSSLFSVAIVPTDISNLELWVDFSDASTLTMSGSSITGVVSKDPSSHASVSVTSVLAELSALNGKQVADFGVGTNNSNVDFGDLEVHDNTRGLHVIVVAQANSTNDMLVAKYGSSSLREWYMGTSVFRNYELATGGTQGSANLNISDMEWSVYEAKWAPGAIVKTWMNGIAYGTDYSVPNSMADTAANLYLGAYNTGTSSELSGKIAEVIIYSDNLTENERAGLVSYLSGKYGLALNPPGQSAELNDLKDVDAPNPNPGAKLFYNEGTHTWEQEPLPILVYKEVICADWAPTLDDIYDFGSTLIINARVSFTSFVGNATVAVLNGLTPTAGDAYLVTDAGTLTTGSLAVVAGDVVVYSGTAWVMGKGVGSSGYAQQGVRFQLSSVTTLIAPYTGYSGGEYLYFDGTSNTGVDTALDVVLTLPAPTGLPAHDGMLRRLYLGIMSDTEYGKVDIAIASSGVFSDGLEKAELRKDGSTVMLAAFNAALQSTWQRISSMKDVMQIRRAATWAAANFSTATALPFDTADTENNDAVSEWAITPNPSYVSINYTSRYTVSGFASLDSTGGSTWTCEAYLAVNGTEVSGTRIRTGNYGGEDQALTLSPMVLDLEDGDYLEWVFDQASLTGNLRAATLSVVCDY